jgi:hypothetical protein
MLSKTSTEWAPWYVIPADRKWFARVGAGAVLVHALMEIDPRFPSVSDEQRRGLAEAKQALEAQAPKGVVRDPFEPGRDGAGGKPASDGAGGARARRSTTRR